MYEKGTLLKKRKDTFCWKANRITIIHLLVLCVSTCQMCHLLPHRQYQQHSPFNSDWQFQFQYQATAANQIVKNELCWRNWGLQSDTIIDPTATFILRDLLRWRLKNGFTDNNSNNKKKKVSTEQMGFFFRILLELYWKDSPTFQDQWDLLCQWNVSIRYSLNNTNNYVEFAVMFWLGRIFQNCSRIGIIFFFCGMIKAGVKLVVKAVEADGYNLVCLSMRLVEHFYWLEEQKNAFTEKQK